MTRKRSFSKLDPSVGDIHRAAKRRRRSSINSKAAVASVKRTGLVDYIVGQTNGANQYSTTILQAAMESAVYGISVKGKITPMMTITDLRRQSPSLYAGRVYPVSFVLVKVPAALTVEQALSMFRGPTESSTQEKRIVKNPLRRLVGRAVTAPIMRRTGLIMRPAAASVLRTVRPSRQVTPASASLLTSPAVLTIRETPSTPLLPSTPMSPANGFSDQMQIEEATSTTTTSFNQQELTMYQLYVANEPISTRGLTQVFLDPNVIITIAKIANNNGNFVQNPLYQELTMNQQTVLLSLLQNILRGQTFLPEEVFLARLQTTAQELQSSGVIVFSPVSTTPVSTPVQAPRPVTAAPIQESTVVTPQAASLLMTNQQKLARENMLSHNHVYQRYEDIISYGIGTLLATDDMEVNVAVNIASAAIPRLEKHDRLMFLVKSTMPANIVLDVHMKVQGSFEQ